MISARNVSKWFGTVLAVRDVSFDIDEGQVVGLLGPNGAGKTTTIRMVTGYSPPSAGAIAIAGHDTVADSINARRLLGYLPEATPLYPEMPVRSYLQFRGRLFGMTRASLRTAIGRVAERCWLTDVLHRRIGELSKGYKQRVGLAASLLHDPRVLILDEPTSGLDPTQIRQTRDLIRDLAASRTVLVSSHILPEVEKTCDRVIIIARGRIRADGPPSELLARSRQHAEYLVELKLPEPGGSDRLLADVQGVESVMRDGTSGEWTRLRVRPRLDAPDLREAIAEACRRADAPVRELHRATPSLEQLFIRLVEREEDPD